MSQVLTQALRSNVHCLRKSQFSFMLNSSLSIRPALCSTRLSSSSSNSPASSDGVPIHPVNRWEGSWHWLTERGLSVALVPMLGVSMLYGGNPYNDFMLGLVLPIHTHIGLSSVITDYLPYRRLPIINRTVRALQIIMTTATIYGCYLINTEDVGLTEYFKKMWKA